MELVSIIVPVYNVEKYLQRSIDSIINQTYSNWELILINDGSTDYSLEICKENQKKDSRIKVYTQKNQGSGIARNTGLEYCNGEYICFVDPDDYLDSNSLIENVEIMNEYNPDIIVNGFREITSNHSNRIVVIEKKPTLAGLLEFNEFRERFEEFEKISPRPIWNKMYQKDFIKKNKIKFPDQRVGQDAIFNNDIYRFVKTVYVNSMVYYNYDRTREGSAVKTFNKNRFLYDFNIAESYKKLYLNWNTKESLKISLNSKYIDCIMNEVININLPDSNISCPKASSSPLDQVSAPNFTCSCLL